MISFLSPFITSHCEKQRAEEKAGDLKIIASSLLKVLRYWLSSTSLKVLKLFHFFSAHKSNETNNLL